MVLEGVESFSKSYGADVLVYYCREGVDSKIDSQDFSVITGLIREKKEATRKRLVLMIHAPDGGNINPMFSLIEYLRSTYTTEVDAVVFNCAVSSGAFLALSCKNCYLDPESHLSDFTLEPNQNNLHYNAAQGKSLELAFSGAARTLSGIFWIQRMIFKPNGHGSPIPAKDFIESSTSNIYYTWDYPISLRPLGVLHNSLVEKFQDEESLQKVYGLNGLFFSKLK